MGWAREGTMPWNRCRRRSGPSTNTAGTIVPPSNAWGGGGLGPVLVIVILLLALTYAFDAIR